MTDADKERDRTAKRALISALPMLMDDWEERREMLDDTDPRIMEYCIGAATDPEAHNLYELQGIVRFFTLLNRYAWNCNI